MTHALRRLWRHLFRGLEKQREFLYNYVEADIPSHYAIIDSEDEGRVRAILVGYDDRDVYVRRPDLTIARYPKVDVLRFEEEERYAYTVYAGMSYRLGNQRVTGNNRALVEVTPYDVFVPKGIAKDRQPFYIRGNEANREANRLMRFYRGYGMHPCLITMFVDDSEKNQFHAWFGHELKVIDVEPSLEVGG